MQTRFQTKPFPPNVCIDSAGYFECEKPEGNNRSAKEDGKNVQLKMDHIYTALKYFQLPKAGSSMWSPVFQSVAEDSCWSVKRLGVTSLSTFFPRLVLPSQLTLLQAATLFCSLALRAEWTGTGQFDRSGFSRWARLVGCKGLCSGTKLFVDGSGAILCYTDTLPSAADCANFVLALVLCLKCCLSYSEWI